MKNPFNALLGLSDLLLKQIMLKDDEKVEKYAKIIRNAANDGYKLLINLLDWSRIQIDRLDITIEPLNLWDIINENIILVYPVIKEKGIHLSLPEETDYLVLADKFALNTVIRNLLSNAIKYTHNDGSIAIIVKPNGGFYEISIKDNGIGIKSSDLEKLFRLDVIYSTPGINNEKGTGLGLILCKDFIYKIGGKIWVNSEFGKGSVFTFTVPVALI